MFFSSIWSLYEISHSVCSFSIALDYIYIYVTSSVYKCHIICLYKQVSIKKKSGPVPEEDEVQGLTS